ncbi:MAG: DUF6398 domain-containing protein, partial [Acidimicrobiales bacterium]
RAIRAGLACGAPLDLLAEASGLAAVADPRQRRLGALRGGEEDGVSLEALLGTFVDIDIPETTALLAAFSVLAPDEVNRRRAARALAGRRHPMPEWLARLGEATAGRTVEMRHLLGDGDNIIVGIHLAGGRELAAVLYVDHNLGRVAKDGFVVPGTVDELIATMKRIHEDPKGTTWEDVDPADARARMEEAIEHGAMMFPPLESDTWPQARPLVGWAARLLPAGGRGYEPPEWDDDARAAITEAFFASAYGRELDDGEHRDLFESILWFGCDYGPGDPYHWSPVSVEMLLADWIPRKIVAPVDFLRKAPPVVRAVTRWAHEQRGIPARWTDETLAAVDAWEPEYQRLIRTPRPQGPLALLAAMGAVDPDEEWDMPFGVMSLEDRLEQAVGGPEALASLEASPLPDEPFDWGGIPDDIRDRVAELLAHVDRYCDAELDVELRTACRRLLARAASGDPAVFRRSFRVDATAGGVVWAIAKANGLMGNQARSPRRALQAKELAAAFGLSTSSPLSSRAYVVMRAAGIPVDPDRNQYLDLALGSPGLLVAQRRRDIMERRDGLG